nr:immunoglobulin heavy chain junction region [Mus musculus]
CARPVGWSPYFDYW